MRLAESAKLLKHLDTMRSLNITILTNGRTLIVDDTKTPAVIIATGDTPTAALQSLEEHYAA